MFRYLVISALVAVAMANYAGPSVAVSPAVGVAATQVGYGPGAGAHDFGNFMGYYKQYRNVYNPWFVNYCNNYLTSHPTGQFVPIVRQYLTAYGNQYGDAVVAPAVTKYNFDNFYNLWGKHHGAYSNYFLNYCNNYLQTMPTGPYVTYAKQYVTKFGGENYGPTPRVRIGISYGTPAIEKLIAASGAHPDAAYGQFYKMWTHYHGKYSQAFLKYCLNYLRAHPTGQYYDYARKYIHKYSKDGVTSNANGYRRPGEVAVIANAGVAHARVAHGYGGRMGVSVGTPAVEKLVGASGAHPDAAYAQFNNVWSTYHGRFHKNPLAAFGAGYGATGAAVGPYNYNNFMGNWNQYRGGYSKYFVDYCNNYVQTHPRGQYLAYANQYIHQYAGYGATPAAVVSPDFGNFMGYYKQYRNVYNPWFVNYCNSYLTSHPTGQFVPIVRQYLSAYGNEY